MCVLVLYGFAHPNRCGANLSLHCLPRHASCLPSLAASINPDQIDAGGERSLLPLCIKEIVVHTGTRAVSHTLLKTFSCAGLVPASCCQLGGRACVSCTHVHSVPVPLQFFLRGGGPFSRRQGCLLLLLSGGGILGLNSQALTSVAGLGWQWWVSCVEQVPAGERSSTRYLHMCISCRPCCRGCSAHQTQDSFVLGVTQGSMLLRQAAALVASNRNSHAVVGSRGALLLCVGCQYMSETCMCMYPS